MVGEGDESVRPAAYDNEVCTRSRGQPNGGNIEQRVDCRGDPRMRLRTVVVPADDGGAGRMGAKLALRDDFARGLIRPGPNRL